MASVLCRGGFIHVVRPYYFRGPFSIRHFRIRQCPLDLPFNPKIISKQKYLQNINSPSYIIGPLSNPHASVPLLCLAPVFFSVAYPGLSKVRRTKKVFCARDHNKFDAFISF